MSDFELVRTMLSKASIPHRTDVLEEESYRYGYTKITVLAGSGFLDPISEIVFTHHGNLDTIEEVL